ncbi:MAG: hypothetical protein H0T89_12650 [Deltaproteobacteria bacterium]|nr:hypothetical protein [Deltaproteobacteria bacterium]MDQ3295581.1 hypothetical protein [Myxococcota bacterium]
MRVVLTVLLLVGCKSEHDDRQASPTPVPSAWVEVDPSEVLTAVLEDEAGAAIKAGKKPHAYLHADWCPPCVAIEKTRTDPTMVAAFASTHIIAIDVDHIDNGQIIRAGMSTSTIPIFFRLDDNGRPTGASLDGDAWGENVPAKMAPSLTAFFAR